MNSLRIRPLGAIIAAEVSFNLSRAAPRALVLLFSLNALLWWHSRPAHGLATNGDFTLAGLFAFFAFFTAPYFTALLMSEPVSRDFRLQVAPLLLAQPISRWEYILGKFFGNFFVLLACHASYLLTLLLLQGVQLPGMIVLPWRLTPFFKHFLVFLVIPHLALGAFCFMVGTLSRSVKLVYALVTGLYLAYPAAIVPLHRLARPWAVALDPLSLAWVDQWKVGRTPAALNRLEVVYDAALLTNRAALILAASACLAVVYFLFAGVAGAAAVGDKTLPSGPLGLLDNRAERLYNDAAHGPADPLPPAAMPRLAGVTPALPGRAVTGGGWRLHCLQLAAATGMEFRLLLAERSLLILGPLVVFLCSLEFSPYGAPQQAVSAVYATNSAQGLLLLLFGLTAFYTGEIFHRERELRVGPLLWSAPAPDWVLLLAKFAAVFLLALCLVVLTALTGMALQAYAGTAPVEVTPYLSVYSTVILPTVALVIALALALNAVLPSKYLAHVIIIALGGASILLAAAGHINWLYNPSLQGLWVYSDLTGLGPDRAGLLLYRAYWGTITVGLVALACCCYRRGEAGRRLGLFSVALWLWARLFVLAC